MKILKIGSKTCQECKTMKPRFAEIEKEYPWLKTEYIGIDKKPEAIKKYQVLSMPTFIFFDKNNKEFKRFTGIVKKDVLIRAILENKDK
ncbi:MAG: thioredoxin family protein [Patescibacteria group bacterium]|nr:thioredoxin family protein [Patescibacteria group bacterium]